MNPRPVRWLTVLLSLTLLASIGAAGQPTMALPGWAIPKLISPSEIPSLHGQDLSRTIPLIGADVAWRDGFSGAGVGVLIIDDFSGSPSHGQWVAGIIHAIAPQAQLWQISVPGLEASQIAQALESAYRQQPQKGYTLLNYSLGSPEPYAASCPADSSVFSDELQARRAQLFRALDREEGLLSVAAAGNNGDPFRLDFPACLAGDVLPAAASWDETISSGQFVFDVCQQEAVLDRPMCFSNSSLVDPPLYAPGYQSDVPGIGRNEHLNSGTSASTPVIVGGAALLTQALRASGQAVSPDRLRRLLYQTGTVIWDRRNGGRFRRLNLSAALAQVLASRQAPSSASSELIEVAGALDANHDRHIDDQEIIKAVGLWVSGLPVPGTDGARIDDALILQLSELWVRQNAF